MLRKVGAFWTAKSGKGYTGKLSEDVAEGARLFLGKNKYKEKDNQPDIILSIIEDDEQEEAINVPEEDDIPF